MFSKSTWLFAILMMFTVTIAEARPKLEIRPFFGLRWGGTFLDGTYIDTFGEEVLIDKMSIGSSMHYGANLYIPLRPPSPTGQALMAELSFNLQAAADFRFSPNSPLPDSISEGFEEDGDKIIIDEMDVIYIHGGLLYKVGNYSGFIPHVNVGLGASVFRASTGKIDETKFSMSMGGGMTKMFTETIGLRSQVRLYFTMLPADGHYRDRYGRVWEITESNIFFQGEFSMGLVFAF